MSVREVQQYSMQVKSFRLVSVDGPEVFVRQWLPEGLIRAAIIIAHGAAEHGARYQRVAAFFAAQGYAVYAPDHRGHGQTAGTREKAGNAGRDGFNGMIRDLKQLADSIQQQLSVPLFLFGHSMGAALTQRFIQLHGDVLRGVMLSGSPGVHPNLEQSAAYTALLAQGEKAEQHSELFSQSFAAYNEVFEPKATGYEWLSRDVDEVQKYVDDPWCGFFFTNRLVAEMSQCALEAAQAENIGRIPKSLPILLLSGTQDRVGGNGEYVRKLAALYRDAGISNVQLKLYAEARHEMLNDTNRSEVQADLVAWLREGLG